MEVYGQLRSMLQLLHDLGRKILGSELDLTYLVPYALSTLRLMHLEQERLKPT